MKNVINIIGLVLFVLSLSVSAKEPTNDQLKEFVTVIGIYEQIEEQLSGIKQQSAQEAQQYAQQVVSAVPDLPPEFRETLEAEYTEFMSKIDTLFDVEQMVNIYVDLISKELTSEEIGKVTEFYKSDLGKKYIKANTSVMKEWALRTMQGFDEKMIVHLETFVNNVTAKAESYAANQ